MFLNYSMPKPARFRATSSRDKVNVAPGIRAAIDPGTGTIALAASNRVDLTFAGFKGVPQWIELAIALSDSEWRSCRSIFMKFQASATQITVHPALRLGRGSGYHDFFSDEKQLVVEELSDYGNHFHLPPRWTEGSDWMDLHLFFTPREGHFTLHDLSLTGVR